MKSKAAAAPYLIWAAIFIIVPLFIVGYFAFTTPDGGFTFAYISQVLDYLPVFWDSILLGAVATVICLIIGFPLAFIISRKRKKQQQTLILLAMLPMWMNFLLRTYAWMTLLEDTGLINRFLESLGFGRIHMINTQGAVILGMVYNFLPYMILPIYSVMTKIGKSLIEAAQDLGGNQLNVFLRVILPLSVPGIISGVTMVFVPAVSTFIISQKLGGGKTLLIGDLVEMQFTQAYNPNLGAAISLVLMIMIFICMGLMNRFAGDDAAVM